MLAHSSVGAVRTTMCVKLSSGRTVIITFEGAKPFQTDSTRALVTTPPTFINSNLVPSRNDNAQVPKWESCAVSVNPSIKILEAQESNPNSRKLFIEVKNRGFPKALIERNDDQNFKIFYRRYDRLFVRDGLLVRSIGNLQPYLTSESDSLF